VFLLPRQENRRRGFCDPRHHALYFSDLAVRESEPEASIIPEHAFVIFDEAHHLEDAASGAFGVSLTSSRLPSLLAKVRRLSGQVDITDDN